MTVDLISRADAIEVAQEAAEECLEWFEKKYKKMIRDEIDTCPSTINWGLQWTPCTERLPGYQTVLLCCEKKSGRYCMVVGKMIDDYGDMWVEDLYGDDIDMKVIAWMPLPKPYEVNNDNS
jgi:hypothetical protein